MKDITQITTNRTTDLIALVKEVSDKIRKTKGGADVTDVTLIDNTMTNSDKLATIVVSVFGTEKIAIEASCRNTDGVFQSIDCL